MRISKYEKMLLVGAMMVATAAGMAQQSQKSVAPETFSVDLAATFAAESSQVVPGQPRFWFKGGGADAAVNFYRGLGIAAAVTGDHVSNVTSGIDVNKIAIMAGPRYAWTAWKAPNSASNGRRVQLYGQGLFGWSHGFNSFYPALPAPTSSAGSLAIQAGGGLNYYLTKNVGLRLVEADYVRTAFPNDAANLQNDLRLSAGVVWHLAAAAPKAVSVACTASPAAVFAGDPVTLTATAEGLNPKLHQVYTWSGDGVTGNGTTAAVATLALAPGAYTVHCGVKEGKTGQEGLKPWQAAASSATFTVRAFEPPTVSCSATPSNLKPGESAQVAARGVSPQNRPLTYRYAATAGAVSGDGASATFNSSGAPTGSTSITCTVSDDKGQTATANTSVTILAPYVAPTPHAQALCSIDFSRDAKRPTRVDNEAKACLDGVALDLARQPEAKVVVVGNASTAEKTPRKTKKHGRAVQVEDVAAQRAVNTKDYLVAEKGIEASRIGVATGPADSMKVENYLVPTGASFTADVAGTAVVNESEVKPAVRKPLPPKHAPKKHAAGAAQ